MGSNLIINKEIEKYINSYSLELNPIQKEIISYNESLGEIKRMQIAVSQCHFLHLIIKISKIKNILEIGTFTGLSALSMSLALPDDGKLICLDKSQEKIKIANNFFKKAKQEKKIKTIIKPALDSLIELNRNKKKFDLIFIDADKENNKNYYDQSISLLNPDGLIGGKLPLNYERALKSIEEKIAKPLNLSVEKAAYGMFTIVNSNMVNGIRRVSVERGYDPRDFVLVAAGGATGAHITALASEMGINTVIVSKLSSGLCAYGQIISDVKYNYMATIPVRLDEKCDYEKINRLFKGIETKGKEHLKNDGFDEEEIDVYRSLEMRYLGQIHECTVNIETFDIDSNTIEKVKDAFHKRHKELYTYSELESPVELVNIESTLYGRIDRPAPAEIESDTLLKDAIKSSRNLIFSNSGESIKTPV